MRKHRSKFIAVAVILVVLAGAWFWGGDFFNGEDKDTPSLAYTAQEKETAAQTGGGATVLPDQIIRAPDGGQGSASRPPAGDASTVSPPGAPPEGGNSGGSSPPAPPSDSPSSPPPLPPGDPQIPDDGTFTVMLTVRADTILRNMHLLDRAKHSLVPPDGVIFPATQVTVTAGENVFDVLQREMRRAGIHMAARFTPIYDSAYVMAINNLFEFDLGPLSGWMYRVNGTFPGFGATQYILRPGDVIEWLYTVDLGRDIGGGFS